MNFENWWDTHKNSFQGTVCDKLVIKHHLKMGWEAHTSESMKPLTDEIIEDAKNIKDTAEVLKKKIEQL